MLTRPLFKVITVAAGGMVGMLALNGIFILVTKHGLEYPAFYERLYGLLTADAFQVGSCATSSTPGHAFVSSQRLQPMALMLPLKTLNQPDAGDNATVSL